MPGAVSKNLGNQNFYKMNHKWKDDCCTECGCKREKRHRVVNTYSKLMRSGIFEKIMFTSEMDDEDILEEAMEFAEEYFEVAIAAS